MSGEREAARLTDEEREALLCDCLCDGAHDWRCAMNGVYDLLLDVATVVERVEAILAARLAPTAAEQVHAARAVADDAARIAGQVRASGEGREG